MDYATKSKIRTLDGLINRMYWQQVQRSKDRGHKPPSYTLESFKIYCLTNDGYHNLFKDWKKSDFNFKLIPSFDRLDNSIGYSFDNIELVTWKENNKRATDEIRKEVYQYTLDGLFIKKHKSIQHAADYAGCDRSSISRCRDGIRKTAGGYRWNKK